MIKPIMSKQVEEDVLNSLSQFRNRGLWSKWGMESLREQGEAILLSGPPGCGKTTIAKWIANQVGKGFKQLDMSQLQSDGTPGSTESKVDEFFDDCKRRHNCTIFMDECEAILISRDSIGEAGLTWQLGTVNKIITRMNLYRGLILAATNHSSLMDSALTDRFISIIHVKRPDEQARRRLWKQKIPRSFPLKQTTEATNRLSHFDLSGRQIETVIINCASNALRLGKAPSIEMMEQYCQRETKKHL